MNHLIKRVLFRSYALISITAFITAISFFSGHFLTWQEFAGIGAGILAFAFGIQKQHVEEMKLFKELFERFNARYDELHEQLNCIYLRSQREPDSEFALEELATLFKYFNLCGEEYFYFHQGFIDPGVWIAWENGMEFFRRSAKIKKLWGQELCNNSYYGLTFD
ncbi:MAG: hypothetical protein C5B58_05800 [Acidobacteria bacterium]|nr:MAG: hypothetical protein C5B58_05800 [Acidobacteriota bacterium]